MLLWTAKGCEGCKLHAAGGVRDCGGVSLGVMWQVSNVPGCPLLITAGA